MILILEDLERRAASEEEACALADAVVLSDLTELLESLDPDLRRRTCNLIGKLALHRSTIKVIMGTSYPRLMTLLRRVPDLRFP
jgi:hypothetical protein